MSKKLFNSSVTVKYSKINREFVVWYSLVGLSSVTQTGRQSDRQEDSQTDRPSMTRAGPRRFAEGKNTHSKNISNKRYNSILAFHFSSRNLHICSNCTEKDVLSPPILILLYSWYEYILPSWKCIWESKRKRGLFLRIFDTMINELDHDFFQSWRGPLNFRPPYYS